MARVSPIFVNALFTTEADLQRYRDGEYNEYGEWQAGQLEVVRVTCAVQPEPHGRLEDASGARLSGQMSFYLPSDAPGAVPNDFMSVDGVRYRIVETEDWALYRKFVAVREEGQ